MDNLVIIISCKDEWTPEFTDKFGWSVKIKSIQEELFVWICIGSLINWEKTFEDVNENNFDPFLVQKSFVHHARNALKSPVITAKDGLNLLISLKKMVKVS